MRCPLCFQLNCWQKFLEPKKYPVNQTVLFTVILNQTSVLQYQQTFKLISKTSIKSSSDNLLMKLSLVIPAAFTIIVGGFE